MILEVPDFRHFRRCIDTLPEGRNTTIVKMLYLTASRCNEVCTKGSPSDTKTTPLGDLIGVNAIRDAKVGSTTTPVLLLRMPVEKRGRKKKGKALVMDAKTPKPQAQVYKMIALPAREKYEPWTVNLMEWFLDNNKKMGFDLTRQSMYHIVKNVLRRFDFPSYPHALRHFRCTHLVTEYGFNAADVAAITGWKMQTGFNLLSMASPMMDTYLHLTWREYFPKLVKPIDQLLDVTPHVLLEPASDRAPELNLA